MTASTLLHWGEPREVFVPRKNQTYWVRSSFPTPEFWALYRDKKEELRSLGISPAKDEETGAWTINWWSNIGPDKTKEQLSVIPSFTLPDSIAGRLRSYQIEPTGMAVASLLQEGTCAYLEAWDLGTGKSFSSVAVALAMNRKLLVLSRKAAIPAWVKIATEHFGMPREHVTVINPEAVRTGRTPLGKWVVPAGKRKEHWEWNTDLLKDTLLVFDEVHNYGGIETKNSMMLAAVRDQKLKALLLSATTSNTPVRLWAIGYVLGLHSKDDFFPWLYRHGCSNGEYGPQFTCGLDWYTIKKTEVGAAELEKRQDHVMGTINKAIFTMAKGYRVRKMDIPDFPETEIIPVALDFSETKKINAIYRDMAAALEELDVRDLNNPKARECMMRARQKTELLKVPDIVDEVLNGIEEGMSVAVFVSFKDTVKVLCEKLKTDCCIGGGQPAAVRERFIDGFQADRERKIITNIQAGGESISLHDIRGRYPRLAIISPSFWAETIIQALGRVQRDGGLSKSVQKILFALGTIEEDAYNNFIRKQSRIDVFNNAHITDRDLQLGVTA